MFLKEKNTKPSQNPPHKLNTYCSNKYYNRQYQKKKTTYNKKTSYQNGTNQSTKYISNKNWKKQFTYWKEKENDKNFINTPKRKKNKDNSYTLTHSITYESEDAFLNKNSIDYTTSNSSTHEESNTETNSEKEIKEINQNKNKKNENNLGKNTKKYIKIKKKQRKMSSSSKNLDFKGIEKVQLILSPSSADSINVKSNNNINNGFKSTSSMNIEPYNKFNSVNQELNMAPTVNSILENTEILNVNVKISKDKNALFKLRRFDDLFLTVKLFCEINNIEEKMMKPIITQALSTLNNIYKIYNTQLDKKNINILRLLKTFNNDI